jgi:poly(3-hydroxybutyrate) depolymerase
MALFPREFSQRVAQAARVFIPLALLGGLAGCSAEAPPSLMAITVDQERIAVAGMSSGAVMAGQAHFAWSDRLRGAAMVAGPPYGCAGGSLETALGPCIEARPYLPDANRLAARVRERAAAGQLAPLSGLAGDVVYVLHGRDDATVAPALAASVAGVYAALSEEAGGLEVVTDTGRAFPHLLPTLDRGMDCTLGGEPWLGRCDFDAAGTMMAKLFGEPAGDAAGEPAGQLQRFDQSAFNPPDVDPMMADAGYLYLPPDCRSGAACGVLVVFHGCQQNADMLGEVFVRDAGFNRWGDVHRVAVLYPQVRSSYLPLNPKACWDWWGYTGEAYDTRDGAQLRWLAAALTALGAPMP